MWRKYGMAAILVLICFSGCSGQVDKSVVTERKEKIQEQAGISEMEETEITDEVAEDKSVLEKGYNLPVDSTVWNEEKNIIVDILKKTEPLYRKCRPDAYGNIILTDKIAEKMLNVISEDGTPAYFKLYTGMWKWKQMDSFLKEIKKGNRSKISVCELHEDGGISRETFHYDGSDLYVLYSNCIWNEEGEPELTTISYNRIKRWDYTKKGWFLYELCVPEYPEVTEMVDGCCMFRVKRQKKKYLAFAEKYLIPIGYQGNNLFCSNWDEEHIQNIDYNALYEFLYQIEYKKQLVLPENKEWMEKKEFEALISSYLPVSHEQIRKYAVFDKKKKGYLWCRLGCFNYTLSFVYQSIPEITEIRNCEDGSLELTVDAVCESLYDDKVFSHVVKIRVLEDGHIQFIGNRMKGKGYVSLPEYQYRLGKKKEDY